MRAGFHQKSSILMLYEQQRNGGWEFMWQNHNPERNMNHPWIHQEKAPLRSAASRLHELAEEDNEEEQDRNCHGWPNTCMGCTIDRLRKWLVSRNPTSGWKKTPYRTVQRLWSWQHRSTELGLYHSQQDQSHRLPQGVPETIWHIATWGKVQAGNEHNASTTRCLR